MKTPLLGYLAIASFLIPVGAAIHKWSASSWQMKIFAWFCFISALFSGYEFYLAKIVHERNHFLINLNYLVELLTLYLFFYFITENKRIRIFFLGISTVFLVYWGYDNALFTTSQEINETTAAISRIAMVMGAMIIFIDQFGKVTTPLTESSVFWIVSAVIIYCTGSAFILGFSVKLMKYSLEYFLIMWYVNWSLIILTNVMFAKSFYQKYA